MEDERNRDGDGIHDVIGVVPTPLLGVVNHLHGVDTITGCLKIVDTYSTVENRAILLHVHDPTGTEVIEVDGDLINANSHSLPVLVKKLRGIAALRDTGELAGRNGMARHESPSKVDADILSIVSLLPVDSGSGKSVGDTLSHAENASVVSVGM